MNESWAQFTIKALGYMSKKDLAEFMGVCVRSVERYAAGYNEPHPAVQELARREIEKLILSMPLKSVP